MPGNGIYSCLYIEIQHYEIVLLANSSNPFGQYHLVFYIFLLLAAPHRPFCLPCPAEEKKIGNQTKPMRCIESRKNLHNSLPPPYPDVQITWRNNTIPDHHIRRAHCNGRDFVVKSNVCKSELHHVGCEPNARDYVSDGIVKCVQLGKGEFVMKDSRSEGGGATYQACLPYPNATKRSSLVDR